MITVSRLKVGDKLGKINNYPSYKYPRYDFYTVDRISKNGNVVLSDGKVLYKNTLNDEYEYREDWMYKFNIISSKVKGLDILDIKNLVWRL